MTVGKLYRNKKMSDVDFYVTGDHGAYFTGFWVLRTSQDILNIEPDKIDKDDVQPEDWEKVQ